MTAATSGIEDPIRQKCRALITSLVPSKFSATLKNEPDIVNTFMGLIYRESSFDPLSLGNPLGGLGTASKDYLRASAIQAVNSGTDPTAKLNISSANRALGLCQVLGFYFIRNSSAKNGKNELERNRPDLAGALLVNPGDNVSAFVLGEANIEKMITAGLVILESKYRAVVSSNSGWKVNGDPFNRTFSTKLTGAVAAYLGLGVADQIGTTPESYAASIVGGQAYLYAKDPKIQTGQRVLQSGGQVAQTNGSGSAHIAPAGCTG